MDGPIDDFSEMTVDSIRVHVPSGQHVVILREKGSERVLPIWIGTDVANAIALRITDVMPDRPITHDLLATFLSCADIKVDSVVVTGLAHEVFYARIHATMGARTLTVDSRPSDAIALAVRVGARIMVAPEVMSSASMTPDTHDSLTEAPETDERLTQLRDWVNSLELPDLGSGS